MQVVRYAQVLVYTDTLHKDFPRHMWPCAHISLCLTACVWQTSLMHMSSHVWAFVVSLLWLLLFGRQAKVSRSRSAGCTCEMLRWRSASLPRHPQHPAVPPQKTRKTPVSRTVRGSYSARVPRSSLARVRRVFFTHIMEEEGEDQENEKDDRREDGTAESRRVSRRESEQPHHERMKIGWSEMCATRQTWATVDVTLEKSACRCEENVTCEVCCSHPPSVAADC